MEYTVEQFSQEEAEILNQYFTNIDRPVFGLMNLPEVVKGALFARYSRSPKSLRRLFLDEFYNKGDLRSATLLTEAGTQRAKDLYDLIFLEYGDDSVAQLGGAHIACEQVSNILAKFIEKGRLAAYLEQSTRYVFYNQKTAGRYKFVTPAEIANSVYKADYEKYIASLFDTYTVIIDKLIPHFREKYPNPGGINERAWENTLKAKACDVARGLLPASTKTNLGIYANGQTYEYLLIKMFSSGISEVRDYAQLMLEELRRIIPSFLVRVDREDRGVVWSDYLRNINSNMERCAIAARESLPETEIYPEVELVEWDDDAMNKLVADALYENSENSLEELLEYSRSLSDHEKATIIKSYFGNRVNRRHKPGRAAESVFYKFDICSDYGAFRDLQRHRMLTVQWQRLTPDLGYTVPSELDEFPGLRSEYCRAIEDSRELHGKLKNSVGIDIAQYAIPFACKMRYSINMNLREAFHLIELRTQKQGHTSYRQVCNKMHRLIREKAGHDIFAGGMIFVDQNEYEHSREDSENKFTK
jgi:thymidylate synthase ThyX